MKVVKYIKDYRGFTLLEIIVALAIISILAVSFLPVFTFGFKSVIEAGKRTDLMFDSQGGLEEKIVEDATASTDSLTIDFPAQGSFTAFNLTVDGDEITNGSMKLFIPQR